MWGECRLWNVGPSTDYKAFDKKQNVFLSAFLRFLQNSHLGVERAGEKNAFSCLAAVSTLLFVVVDAVFMIFEYIEGFNDIWAA